MAVKITRADKSFCRKWLSAHRKCQNTAQITREWLSKLERPSAPAEMFLHTGLGACTVDFTTRTSSDLYNKVYAQWSLPICIEPHTIRNTRF